MSVVCISYLYLQCFDGVGWQEGQPACKKTTFGYHPVGAPTCLRKQEVGKPSQNAAQPYDRAQGYVNDDLRANGLQKSWDFGSVPGMVTH